MRNASPLALVADKCFLIATRESGYRDVVSALSELVDNSLEAGASHIHVMVLPTSDGKAIPLVAVLDDGSGMPPDLLRTSLQFGGSNRFDSRSGSGRFGMGLPNSSISQSRSVEVYSWQSVGEVYSTHIDVDELIKEPRPSIPIATRRVLPDWVPEARAPHGTLVVWSRCDRIPSTAIKGLVRKISAGLGRQFRYAIWSGTEIRVNDSQVNAIDPLYLHPSARFQAIPYGTPLEYNFTARNETHVVRVRFTELPLESVNDWNGKAKRSAGISGGRTVSILRNQREIDAGWFFMGGKRRENYDDWWRCEISFPPALDELFGVTHTKQGINPSQQLAAVLAPDIEAIARVLNCRVRQRFQRMKATLPNPAAIRATARDKFLPIKTTSASAPLLGPSISYEVKSCVFGNEQFFDFQVCEDKLTLFLNEEHPFMRLYKPSSTQQDTNIRFALDVLLLAYARSQLSSEAGATDSLALRGRWADSIATLLDQ